MIKESIQLSVRESEVLGLILEENTTIEMAHKLYVSFETIKSHRKKLLQKFGVKSSIGLVKKAFELGLIQYSSSNSIQ